MTHVWSLMAIQGQDWASYQSATPSTAGLDFVFVKATEAEGYVNPRMKSQAAHARKAGLIVGFYHFVRPGNMAAQAAYFVDRADSVDGDPLVLDWEDAGVSNSDKDAFIKEVIRLRGSSHRVGLYCNVNFWLNRDKTSYCGDFLWIAQYGGTMGKPSIEYKWLIHQYTSTSVDKNVAQFASRAAMREWADKEPVSPKPDPKPVPKPVVGQAAKLIALARAEVGFREGANNKTKYAPAVPGLEWAQNQAWCQTFQSWLALKAGTAKLEPLTASCALATSWFKARKRFSSYPAVGAHLFFGPGGGTHVGRVYAYDADFAYTVEGNTNNNGSANGDGVYLRKRPRRDSYLHGYGMPAFTEGVVTADPALKGRAGFTYKAAASAPAVPSAPTDPIIKETGMTAKDTSSAVWNRDEIPAPPSAETYKTNPTWKASSYLKELYEREIETQRMLGLLATAVYELQRSVNELHNREA